MNMDNLEIVQLSDIVIKNKENRKLLSTIVVPSASHTYSLAVEFIKEWALSKFPKDYFKTVYVEDSHIFGQARKFSTTTAMRRENPAIKIIPSIDTSYNRDTVDLNLGGLDFYQKRSTFDGCFFRDYENNRFIKAFSEIILFNVNIIVRVDSRPKQLDVLHYMKLAYRVGASQSKYLDMDINIPYKMMLQLAHDTGFEIEGDKIKNIPEFLHYLNSHSDFPIMYKLRCVNGKNEFFVRCNNVYTHIRIPDQLSIDNGDRNNHVDMNFNIELNLELRFPGIQSYEYMSKDESTIIESVETSDPDIVGLHSIKIIDIPKTNEKGWNLNLQTEYDDSSNNEYIEIRFLELLENNIRECVEYNKKILVSVSAFIDIKIFYYDGLLPYDINWDTFTIKIKNTKDIYHIAIYVDNVYVNNTIELIKNTYSNRLISENA